MGTDAQLAGRDRSSRSPGGEEERSRFSRTRRGLGLLTGGGPWRRAGELAAVCVVFVLLLSAFVVQPFLIPSGSMEDTFRPGDRVLVNKLAYRFGDTPRRGDVI